ncbi:MAG TPA: hypothetical protein DDY78_16225 [Planctomycetales bacterium]|jgi:plasmid stabilization system protein ParE|nr:hypothetical protein [Planctomycetales bacterium]
MFRVRWEKSALDELTSLWLKSESALRHMINAAVNQIEQLLRTNPLRRGESRGEGRRILFAAPLGITFRVEKDRRTVSVSRVWLYRVRGK